MSDKHINHHLINHSLKSATEGMEPFNEYKSPALAAILGLLFGAIGIGLYFGWKDGFRACIIWVFCLIVAVPTGGAGLVMGPMFSAAYGYRRAQSSNRQLGLA